VGVKLTWREDIHQITTWSEREIDKSKYNVHGFDARIIPARSINAVYDFHNFHTEESAGDL
jgi:hypothetical protein